MEDEFVGPDVTCFIGEAAYGAFDAAELRMIS
jgi:hypothetical protein